MNPFDWLPNKNNVMDADTADVLPACKDGLQTAEAAMNIVDAGIKNNDLTDISEQLGNLPLTDDEQGPFVFESEPTGTQFLTIGISVALSIIFIALLILGVNTALLSDLFDALGVGMALVSTIALMINISIIASSIEKLRYKARYDRYYNLLRFHRIEAIDDIAEITNYKRPLIVRDLSKAVKMGYIPEGHFGRNNFLFMVSNKIYDGYQKKPAVYDHYFKGKIEERLRMRGHDADTQRILETGKSYIEKIHDSNDLIKDKAVTDKLNRMERTVSMIFQEVSLHPELSEKLGMFLNYYLPTTDKLLQNYISIDEKGTGSRSLGNMLQELSEVLDTINTAFERILETLYMEQESDILSDIAAMETMMDSEGLS